MEVIIKKSYLKVLKKVPKAIFSASNTVIDKLKSSSSLENSGLGYIKMEGQKKGENYYRVRNWRLAYRFTVFETSNCCFYNTASWNNL